VSNTIANLFIARTDAKSLVVLRDLAAELHNDHCSYLLGLNTFVMAAGVWSKVGQTYIYIKQTVDG